jgi:hypothetical protein
MSNQTDGLKKALLATRQKNRELQEQVRLLKSIVENSNMVGMVELIELSESYFGGIFDRLGFKSRWLTAMAWSEYPDKSFNNLTQKIEQFCPQLASLFAKHGINFAIIAPGEVDPGENKVRQLAYNSKGMKAQTQDLRVYTLELFLEIPNQDLVAQLYEAHRQELETVVREFEKELLQEVETHLSDRYKLAYHQLESLCLPY